MAVHVDNCMIAAWPPKLMEELKQKLRTHVEVANLGELRWLLGIEIAHDRDTHTICLSQQLYIEDIVCFAIMGVWLCSFISDVFRSTLKSITFFLDNQLAIALSPGKGTYCISCLISEGYYKGVARVIGSVVYWK